MLWPIRVWHITVMSNEKGRKKGMSIQIMTNDKNTIKDYEKQQHG